MSRQHRSPTLITLGRTVRAFREHAGMIQLELAKQLGYTNAWLSNIETGQIRPREDQLAAIEDILKIPDGVLMYIRKQFDAESLPGHFRPWSGEEWLASVIRSSTSRWSRICSRSRTTPARCPATRPPYMRGWSGSGSSPGQSRSPRCSTACWTRPSC